MHNFRYAPPNQGLIYDALVALGKHYGYSMEAFTMQTVRVDSDRIFSVSRWH